MSFKTILVHCDSDKAIAQRLSIATDIASAFDSHVIGMHVRAPFQPPVYFDDGFAMDQLFHVYEDRIAADQKVVSEAIAKANDGQNINIDRVIVDGQVDQILVKGARYADLVILGQTNGDTPTLTPLDLPEVVALAAGRPVLVVPYIEIRRPIGKNVVLCWNETRESARAATDALPLLRKAEQVTVLGLRAEGGDTGARDVAVWLSSHGVKASAREETAKDTEVGDLILSRAADLDADLIVMGVYGHTRVREMVMGGVSRTLLRSMTVPVFMAH